MIWRIRVAIFVLVIAVHVIGLLIPERRVLIAFEILMLVRWRKKQMRLAFDQAEEFVKSALWGQRVKVGLDLRLGQLPARMRLFPPILPAFAAFHLAATQMPFTGHHGLITRRLQQLGDGRQIIGQARAISGFFHLAVPAAKGAGAKAGVGRIAPCQERGTRRAAAPVVIKVAKAQAVCRHAVEVGRIDLTAIAAEIGVARIVGHNDNDVGTLRCRLT